MQGKGQDAARQASDVFADFQERLKTHLANGEDRVKTNATGRGGSLSWTVEACILAEPLLEEDE